MVQDETLPPERVGPITPERNHGDDMHKEHSEPFCLDGAT